MLRFDGFEFDTKSAKLTNTSNGKEVLLRQKLVALLVYLSTHHSRVVSKQELLNELWDHGQYRERSLSQSILELRKALGDSASAPKYIRTVPNNGYQWVCPEPLEVSGLDVEPFSVSRVLRRSKLSISLLVSVIILLVIAFFYWGYLQESAEKNITTSLDSNISNKPLRVLILPFINQSGTSAMNWVQYGLSEMLAYDLALIKHLDIIAPTQLSSATFTTPLTDESTQQLLTQYSADMAVSSVFLLEKQQQIINYTLLTPQGRGDEKQLRRSDLAVSMPDVASEIYRDIQPNTPEVDLPKYAYVPSAMHDFARGLQALQSESYILAQYYFQASMQIDKNHHWSILYQAISQLNLGHWNKAEQLLAGLEAENSEPGLMASVNYWQALLFYRQGLLELSAEYLRRSTKYLEASPQTAVLAQIKQLSTKLAQLENFGGHIQIPKEATFHDQVSLFEIPLFDGVDLFALKPIDNAESLSSQLTIKRHKPALLRLLISYSMSKSLSAIQRSSAIARAVEIARKLQQPYDLALVLMIQGRIAIEEQSPLAKTYFLQTKRIAELLQAPPLLKEVEFYLVISDMIVALDLGDTSALLKAKLRMESIDVESIDAHKKALLRRATKWH
ncbi:MAG: winged helix-turn-helix domain-containing protein [Pseudomonadales bacterium]